MFPALLPMRPGIRATGNKGCRPAGAGAEIGKKGNLNMNELEKIRTELIDGEEDAILGYVDEALQEQVDPAVILEQGLLAGMNDIADKWAAGEAFIPEVLIGARIMNAAMEQLEPLMVSEDRKEESPRVVFGTVQGDLHDIGKNLCILLLRSQGISVLDLGVDVAPEAFVEAVKRHHPAYVCMSSLLTTTMDGFARTLEALRQAGLRDSVKVAVGGAPVTPEFAASIGADLYTADAVELSRVLG